MHIGRYTVALPPESFLQPTKEGETIVQELVREEAGAAGRIADLFSGCGTFALALADGRNVHAVDSADSQIEALTAAAKAGGAKLTAEIRDLFPRPLLSSQLARFDAVVLDPPPARSTAGPRWSSPAIHAPIRALRARCSTMRGAISSQRSSRWASPRTTSSIFPRGRNLIPRRNRCAPTPSKSMSISRKSRSRP